MGGACRTVEEYKTKFNMLPCIYCHILLETNLSSKRENDNCLVKTEGRFVIFRFRFR
jgi:hypothetical protein